MISIVDVWESKPAGPGIELCHKSPLYTIKLASSIPNHTALTPLQTAYQKQEDSVFFGKFPSEIRIKIYQELLKAHEPVNPLLLQGPKPDSKNRKDDSTQPVEHQAAPRLDATIARACRATVFETYPILYGQNVFSFFSEKEISRFKNGHLKTQAFGTPLIAGSEGRFSLLRHMLLTYRGPPSPHRVGFLGILDNPRNPQCWQRILESSAIEHLHLLFTGSLSKYHATEFVKIIVAETKPYDDGVGGALLHLKKLTIVKGYDRRTAMVRLKDIVGPGIELVEIIERQADDSDTEEAR